MSLSINIKTRLKLDSTIEDRLQVSNLIIRYLTRFLTDIKNQLKKTEDDINI